MYTFNAQLYATHRQHCNVFVICYLCLYCTKPVGVQAEVLIMCHGECRFYGVSDREFFPINKNSLDVSAIANS